ncbi:MAG: hypothetical protein PGN30_14205 [Mycolicibacterium neoaurum]|uniref:hypothetical protein n=1 Tax=Mycolicibacterium neoaurum TaxID=1795 RepID=UPI002FFD31EC
MADPRRQEQQNHEKAMSEVSDVMVNLDHTIARATKARKRLGESPEEHNAKLALSDALNMLRQVRTRLERDTYFGGDELRLV